MNLGQDSGWIIKLSVALEITAEALQPNEVDTFLGLSHTSGFVKGKGNVHGGPPYGAWAYRSSIANQGENLEDHIQFLLSTIEPIQDKLDFYINSPSYTVVIRIFYRNNLDIASIDINSSILRRLAQLCNNFHISLIGDTEEDLKT